MVKTASELGFDALARLAKAATDDVVASSMRDKTELPVWLNGEVVYKHVIKLQDEDRDEIRKHLAGPVSSGHMGEVSEARSGAAGHEAQTGSLASRARRAAND